MPTLMAERPSLAPDVESAGVAGHAKKKRGPKPKPVVEFPQALEGDWVDPSSFPEALALHMRRHGDSCNHLHRAIIGPRDKTDRKTIQTWVLRTRAPGTIQSLAVLERIEHRYRLRDREVLLAITGEVAGPEVAAANAGEKGKALKAIISDCLEGASGRVKAEPWIPQWMAFPPSAYTARGGVGSVKSAKRVAAEVASHTASAVDQAPSLAA